MTITTAYNTGASLVGIGAAPGYLTVASSTTNYDLNPDTLSLLGAYPNSGGVVDIGKTANGLSTIELHANGTFSVFSDADRSVIHSATIASFTTAAWGISDSRIISGKEYVWIGYQYAGDSSSSYHRVGLYNLSDSIFNQEINYFNVGGLLPNGLGAYLSADGSPSRIDHYRLLVSLDPVAPVTILDRTQESNAAIYFTGSTAFDVEDVTHSGHNLIAVSSDGSVELGAFAPRTNFGDYTTYGYNGGSGGSIPEVAEVSLFFGMFALAFVAIIRRPRA